MPNVVLEFYGIARLKAGVATAEVCANTLGQLVKELEKAYPLLIPLLKGHIAFNINGERFASDVQEILKSGERVLVMGADVGG